MKSFAFVGRSPWYGSNKLSFITEELLSEWNGYVAIEKDLDPADSYDELNEMLGNACPHGGVTFAGLFSPETLKQIEKDNDLFDIDWGNYVIYGFDTLHLGDTRDKWPKEAVLKEAERFEQNLIDLIDGNLQSS